MAAHGIEQFLRFHMECNYPKEFPSGADMQFQYLSQTAQWEIYCPSTGMRARLADAAIERAGFTSHGPRQAENIYRPEYNYREDHSGYDPVGELRGQQRINKELTARLELAEQELSDLRRRFESLFRVPAVGMRTEMDQPSENPEQWRVRIHVPAFTVETTMGALTAAKGAPGLAMTWGHGMSYHAKIMEQAMERAGAIISSHIVTGDHPIESAEPNTPIELDFK